MHHENLVVGHVYYSIRDFNFDGCSDVAGGVYETWKTFTSGMSFLFLGDSPYGHKGIYKSFLLNGNTRVRVMTDISNLFDHIVPVEEYLALMEKGAIL